MISIIAGAGHLPVEACKRLKEKQKPFFTIALFPETNLQELEKVSQGYGEVLSGEFYKLGTILKTLKKRNVTELLMIGKVDKQNLLKKIRFDWLSVKLMATLVTKSDIDIQQRLVEFIENQGIQVIPQTDILSHLLVKPGVLCGKLTSYLQENIRAGMKTAQEMSEKGIGQTVIMKDTMILAIEAIEGTDQCIQRGIELGKQNNVVVCKTAHQGKNHKYDLPTLGPQSLEMIKKGEVAGIAWESSKTFIVEKEIFIAQAKERGITLVSI